MTTIAANYNKNLNYKQRQAMWSNVKSYQNAILQSMGRYSFQVLNDKVLDQVLFDDDHNRIEYKIAENVRKYHRCSEKQAWCLARYMVFETSYSECDFMRDLYENDKMYNL